MAAKFEKVSKYKDIDIQMPERKTEGAAGYDIAAAEDIVIYPNANAWNVMYDVFMREPSVLTLEEMAELTKQHKTRPTLVPTGLKCKLDPGTYLELSVRSSTPLKYWLILANGVGIIDADYFDNPQNEGEIFFQLINLSPIPLKIQKNEVIGQGIIKPYLLAEGDAAAGQRIGGFGSTTK